MNRTIISISSRYSLDVGMFVKRVFQVCALSVTVTLLLSPPAENLDVGRFLALFVERAFGVALTSIEGAAAVVVMVAAAFGAYKVYPVLAASESFDEGELDAQEFCAAVDKEQGPLRLFSVAALTTGAGFLLTSLGASTTPLDVVAAGFIGLGLLAVTALAYATHQAARCEPCGRSGYVALAQGAYAKRNKLGAADLAKLLLLAKLR